MKKEYRFCFRCDKWKSEKEINEVELGGGNKAYYCNVCRKDLGDQLQIFRCPKHEEVILKVWGTLDGQNKEKIFYNECQKCKEWNEEDPEVKKLENVLTWVIGGAIIILIVLGIYWVMKSIGFPKKVKKNK